MMEPVNEESDQQYVGTSASTSPHKITYADTNTQRQRSSSSRRRSVSTRRSSNALRLRPRKYSSTQSLRTASEPPSASDEQSLISFPSLSPSLEQGLEPSSIDHATLPDILIANGDTPVSSPAVPASFQHLFNPVGQEDRSNLFLDNTRGMRDIPGTLHLQSDASINHFLSRRGTVATVKLLSRDLALRDAHVTLVQRKAEEREMVLRRMLRECEVSHLDIENRLKELEHPGPRRQSGGKASEPSHGTRADASMDDRLAEALSDSVPAAEEASGRNSLQRTAAEQLKNVQSASTGKPVGTSRGWKGLFGGGHANGTQRRIISEPESDANLQTGQLSRTTSQQSTLTVETGTRTRATSGAGSDSGASTSSMPNWALRMVGGTVKKPPQAAGPGLNHTVRRLRGEQRSPRGSLSEAEARKINDGGQRVTSPAMLHSPHGSIDGTTNLGPVEMDTILPEDTRPPTLANIAKYQSDEFLIDNFGFIYDQRRKRRTNAAKAPRNRLGSQVESVQNHRIVTNGDVDEDAISITSRTSLNKPSRPETPLSTDGTQPEGKAWSDYLRLSPFKAELLSHTPAPAVVKEVETAEGPMPSTPGAQISMSTRGSVPAMSITPTPETTRVVSDNAEFATLNDSHPTSPNALPDDKDPVRVLVEHLTEVHEQAQREKTVRWNEFLRKVRASRRRTIFAKPDADSRSRRHVPESLLADGELIGVAGLGVGGRVGRAKGNEFRSLVLLGIPTAYRAKIWAECSGAISLRNPGYYEELVNAPSPDENVVQQIQMDITRTLTDNIYYRRGAGVEKLKEVLEAYAIRNPEVGYCQGMNLITANLLLIMPTAEDAFWVLTSMVERILPRDYYSPSLLTSRADQVVLRRYVTELLPQLSQHLENLNIELEAMTFQWFLSVFTDCLSAEALFRVWDVVLCLSDSTISSTGEAVEGSATFLFQVALALLKLNEKNLMACENPAEIYRYINREMTDHAISIDNLIRASEGLRKEVRAEDVLQRRKQAADEELETMRLRENARKGKGRANDASSAAGAVPSTPTQPSHDSGLLGDNDDTPRPPAKHAQVGQLVRQPSRAAMLQDEQDDLDMLMPYGLPALTIRTPMPIDDEILWRD